MLDDGVDIDDVLLVEDLLVADVEVVLAQQDLDAGRTAERSHQRHALQAVRLHGAVHRVAE